MPVTTQLSAAQQIVPESKVDVVYAGWFPEIGRPLLHMKAYKELGIDIAAFARALSKAHCLKPVGTVTTSVGSASDRP